MAGSSQSFTVTLLTALVFSAAPVHAQAPGDALRVGTWAFGASGEMLWRRDSWGRLDVDSGLDASVERRVRGLGRRDVLGIRVQLGRGTGNGRDEGFDYTRVLAGVIRHLCLREDACYGEDGHAIYFVGGGGVYRLTLSGAEPSTLAYSASHQAGRRKRPSVFGGIGLDRKLGTRRASIRTEIRVYTSGAELQVATSVGLQIHLW